MDRNLIDKLIADYQQLGKSLSDVDKLFPSEVTLNLRPGDNIQSALDSLFPTGGTINLASGDYPVALNLKSKGKLITINGIKDNSMAVGIQGFNSGINTGNIAFNDLSFVNSKTVNHVNLGADKNGMKSLAEVPSGFGFYGVNFIGPTRRGIAANCKDFIVDGCTFNNYKVLGTDSQAILGWNGSQNHIIRNSILEAASENILYGGADAANEDMYPRDILIENNYLNKRVEWKTASYNMKALFELKNAINVTFRRNHLIGNWKQAWGNAPAIVLKSCNQENGNPNARSENILIELNIVENVGTYCSLIGRNDSGNLSGIMRKIIFQNNLFQLMNGEPDGRAFTVSDGPIDVLFDHNTVFDNRHSFVELFDSLAENLRITNNIAMHGTYGLRPSGLGMNPNFQCNAMQIKPVTSAQPQARLGPTNLYYPNVQDDLSAHVTTDGKRVGATL